MNKWVKISQFDIPTLDNKVRLVRLLRISTIFIFALIISTNDASAESTGTYKLGVFPHYSESHIETAYTAIAKDLSEHSSKPIHLDADENFSLNLKQEKYDIVLVQPLDFIDIADKFGYIPLVTQKKAFRAIIVVRENSPLRTLQNLLGRDLYLPPRNTAISYLTKHHLKESGFNLMDDLDITHESTHISCLLKVVIRIADACATAPEAMELFKEKVHVTFSILNKTSPVPHVLIAAHPRVLKKERAALKKQLLSWEHTESG